MANDIVGDGAYLGFMGGGWWRPEKYQNKHNARVMEHVSTLAWFYANERPWNVEGQHLYRNTALLTRLEAAVDYYTSLQLADGSYPEYQKRSSLAATTFGMVAQADAYAALSEEGVSISSQRALRSSMLRAARWFMDPAAAHWDVPLMFFNQLTAGLVGVQRVLQVVENPPYSQDEINEKLAFLLSNGVAPAGFPHEPYGVDFGYNFTVAMPDLAWLHMQVGHPEIVAVVKKYIDFMRYEIIPEPGGPQLSHVAALHNRNVTSSVRRPADAISDRAALAKVFLSEVPSISLFLPTRDDEQKALSEFRSSHQAIQVLDKPHTSPRTWMYAPLAPQGPTAAQRASVEANLPLLRRNRFTKIDAGSVGDSYVFVRRPSYYTVGVFGEHPPGLSTRQLGVLWNPKMGTVLAGTNDPDAPEGWDSIGPGGKFSTRRSSSKISYFDGRATDAASMSVGDAAASTSLFMLRTQSAPDATDYATAWRYWDSGLGFTFFSARTGDCSQRLAAVLKKGDTLTFSDGTVFEEGDSDTSVSSRNLVLKRGSNRFLIDFGPVARRMTVTRSNATLAGGTMHRVEVGFSRQIDLQLVFLVGSASQDVMSEAHRHSDGSVSVRLVVPPFDRGASGRVRISGAGVDEYVSITTPGYQVIERTVTPTTATNALTIETFDSSARRVSRSTVRPAFPTKSRPGD